VQGGAGQFIDSLVVLVLVYASLMAPLLFKEAAEAPADAADKPGGDLGVAATDAGHGRAMDKLGVDIKAAEPMITHRFDYTIEPVSLTLTILVIAGYFVFVLRTSEREYRARSSASASVRRRGTEHGFLDCSGIRLVVDLHRAVRLDAGRCERSPVPSTARTFC
jgi:hypothetical protein